MKVARTVLRGLGTGNSPWLPGGLGKDTPVERPIQPNPAEGGNLIEFPRVGGLHHRYEWRKAA